MPCISPVAQRPRFDKGREGNIQVAARKISCMGGTSRVQARTSSRDVGSSRLHASMPTGAVDGKQRHQGKLARGGPKNRHTQRCYVTSRLGRLVRGLTGYVACELQYILGRRSLRVPTKQLGPSHGYSSSVATHQATISSREGASARRADDTNQTKVRRPRQDFRQLNINQQKAGFVSAVPPTPHPSRIGKKGVRIEMYIAILSPALSVLSFR